MTEFFSNLYKNHQADDNHTSNEENYTLAKILFDKKLCAESEDGSSPYISENFNLFCMKLKLLFQYELAELLPILISYNLLTQTLFIGMHQDVFFARELKGLLDKHPQLNKKDFLAMACITTENWKIFSILRAVEAEKLTLEIVNACFCFPLAVKAIQKIVTNSNIEVDELLTIRSLRVLQAAFRYSENISFLLEIVKIMQLLGPDREEIFYLILEKNVQHYKYLKLDSVLDELLLFCHLIYVLKFLEVESEPTICAMSMLKNKWAFDYRSIIAWEIDRYWQHWNIISAVLDAFFKKYNSVKDDVIIELISHAHTPMFVKAMDVISPSIADEMTDIQLAKNLTQHADYVYEYASAWVALAQFKWQNSHYAKQILDNKPFSRIISACYHAGVLEKSFISKLCEPAINAPIQVNEIEGQAKRTQFVQSLMQVEHPMAFFILGRIFSGEMWGIETVEAESSLYNPELAKAYFSAIKKHHPEFVWYDDVVISLYNLNLTYEENENNNNAYLNYQILRQLSGYNKDIQAFQDRWACSVDKVAIQSQVLFFNAVNEDRFLLQKLNTDWMHAHRNDSAESRHEFDKRYGLVAKKN